MAAVVNRSGLHSRPAGMRVPKGKSTPETEEQKEHKAALLFMFIAEELLGEHCAGEGGRDGAALAEARACVTKLRQVLTNGTDVDVPPPAAETRGALEAAKEALREAGLTDAINARLRRKKPQRFALVHQILPGLWCGGWAALVNSSHSRPSPSPSPGQPADHPQPHPTPSRRTTTATS